MNKLLLSVLIALSFSPIFATQADIFTDTAHPVALDSNQAGLKVNYYNLDVGVSALNEVSQQMQGLQNVEQAQQVLANPVLQAQIKQLKGNFLAASDGLTAYPAIVFDQNVVVYGYVSLQAALGVYQSWQAQQAK